MEKQEIHDLLHRFKLENSEDSKIVQAGTRLISISIFVMIYGGFIWFIILTPGLIISTKTVTTLFILFSSSIVGIALFCYSFGIYLFNKYHIKGVSVSWQFKGIMRTLIQCYYWGSIFILLIAAQYLYPESTYFTWLIFSIPGHIGYFSIRSRLIRNKIESYLIVKYNV